MINLVELKKVHKNIIFAVVISFVIFILGVSISFIITRYLPGDPVQVYLIFIGNFTPTPAEYQAAVHTLGFDLPLIIQFFRYLGNLFIGDWGNSMTIAAGMEVSEILRTTLPRTIEIIFLPLILGLIIGIILGRLSRKFEDHKIGRYIKIFVAIGIAIPAFVFGVIFQFAFSSILPIFGYKSMIYPDPPFITGFVILDSLIDGNMNLAGDIFLHFILPQLSLTIIIIALVTRQYRSNLESNSLTRSVISNTTTIGWHFGLIFTSIILIETTFGLQGFGAFFLNAIFLQDFFVIVAFVNIIVIFFAIVTLISNIIFSRRTEEQFVSLKEVEAKLRWKSPLTIIGLIIIGFFIIIAAYPELISQYSLEELNGKFPGPWQLPSSDHPLGQGQFRRDMLGQIVWGIQFSVLAGIGAVLIGIVGGLVFGLIAARLNELGKNLLTGFILIIYIIPSVILVFLITSIFGRNFIITMIFIGIVLIPSFARIIANASDLEINLFKSVAKYLPLMLGIAIILYESIGFLGFSDPRIINLGYLVNVGRLQLLTFFGFALFPGIAIVLMVTGFILLYEGL